MFSFIAKQTSRRCGRIWQRQFDSEPQKNLRVESPAKGRVCHAGSELNSELFWAPSLTGSVIGTLLVRRDP